MEALVIFIVLLIFIGIVTVAGHLIWITIRWIFRQLFDLPGNQTPSVQELAISKCVSCNNSMPPAADFCGRCGVPRASGILVELLNDLSATLRQLDRFQRSGNIDQSSYESLKASIEAERIRLTSRRSAAPKPSPTAAPAVVVQGPSPVSKAQPIKTPPPSVTEKAADDQTAPDEVWPIPKDVYHGPPLGWQSATNIQDVAPTEVPIAERSIRPEPQAPPSPRRPFSEVLAAFMEQSNIRWGEIIGGLLIIGCSTALVVSLWAQISQIPVLKFFIFTTVTAALFGVGLYTEHRWKLPTTSRGILTIATVLVPLNFLAIAAVSGSTDVLILASEVIAPAVFLCLVYFAGRVLTPKWPHLLAAGVLGSSVGQLLIRHFASPDTSPGLLLALGAFPIACYAGAAAWKLRIAMDDAQIDETETNAIFITLGAITFAALLPFGLLLYKAGPVSMSMMYLAPLVSLGGIPILATGTLLWKRVKDPELRAARLVGTSIAITGTGVVLAGMILAWPNPASIVPAALLNFVAFTAVAVLLELPYAHVLAAFCFAFAWLVGFHVFAGNVAWLNPRVTSLLDATMRASTGQALTVVFVLFVAATEWLSKKQRNRDSLAYLISACSVAVVGLLYLTTNGFNLPGDPHALWFFYLLFTAGALLIAWRRRLEMFALAGSALLLFSLYHAVGPWLGLSFPWQTAALLEATVFGAIAITASQYRHSGVRTLIGPFNLSALLLLLAAIICLLQGNQWETTAMQAERVFWLAGICLMLLWLNRRRAIFGAFQVLLTAAVILSVKAFLQQFDWYAYLPHAFLHPIALQIQGTMLVLLSLAWAGTRLLVMRKVTEATGETANKAESSSWLKDARELLSPGVTIDQLVSWSVLGGFVLLVIYAALPGVIQELTAQVNTPALWDIAGFPHQFAFGVGSWIVAGLLIVLMLIEFRERTGVAELLAVMLLLALLCPLAAARWEVQTATASAWRWFAALLLAVASVPIWFRERLRLRDFGLSAAVDAGDLPEKRQTDVYRIWLLALTLIPLMLLTAYPALREIFYKPVRGPSGSFFYLIGDKLSYSLPLVIAAAALIGYAVRERLVHYAFAAGLLFNVTVTMVYLLTVVGAGASMDRIVSAHALQLNGITSAAYVLVWLSLHSRWNRTLIDDQTKSAERLVNLQIAIAILANVLVILPVAFRLVDQPGWAGAGTVAAASFWGWLSFAFTATAIIIRSAVYRRSVEAWSIGGFLLALGSLLSFNVVGWTNDGWNGFHMLTSATVASAWLVCLASSIPRLASRESPVFFQRDLNTSDQPLFKASWQSQTALIASLVGGIAIVMAMRSATADPGGSGWSVATLLSLSALAAALNWQTLQRAYLYVAGILVVVATSIWCLNQPSPGSITSFLDANIVALCLFSVVSLILELRNRRLKDSEVTAIASFHNFGMLWSFAIFTVMLVFRLAKQLILGSTGAVGVLGWLALAAIAVLMAACLWDRKARYAVSGLYLTGLLALGTILSVMRLPAQRMIWAGTIMLAVYAVVTGFAWRGRRSLLASAERFRIPIRIAPDVTDLTWLSVFNALLIATVICITFWIDVSYSESMLRFTAALAVLAQALSFDLLAEGKSRAHRQRDAFIVFVIGAVFLGWAFLVPGVTGTWLNRALILMVEMFAIVSLFGLELDKATEHAPDWTRAVRSCTPWLAGAGIAALAFVLATEVYYQIAFGAVHITSLALATVAITLAIATIISILFALSPKHDPLNLAERHRSYYVYGAEVMLALLFMHIRLTMPWLFSGFFEQYWPLVVVGISYVGIGAGELLRRRNVLVLAHPLERTGIFLPLLPVLGFWVAGSQVDYSLLLFIIGGLYGLLSILRRSFVFGVLAGVAGNGGLWYLLHRTEDYQFLQHPQLWLIPAACSVLIAAYLNEEDFSEEHMIGIRYLALVTIYASSTADIFLNGVARSPWLPMILAALSLCGVFGGIILRVRAFLILGSVFLLLAITTMIYYASVNFGWTWLWYVAGIVTGMMIIATFALFEKKREEMLRLVDGLKEWQR